MDRKRHFSFENGGESKRQYCGRHDQGLSLHEFMKKLDPTEHQEFCQRFHKHLIDVPHLSSRRHKYRLQFRNKLPDNLFTDEKYEVEIVLKDASNEVVTSGPMASAKIEISVLDGDFHGEENFEWTEEEFNNHVIVARKDKRPLLIGNLSFKLCNGFGRISDAQFTDNSSWTKTKKFRLGAKLCGGIGLAGEVQEGISNAFRVKDRHGKTNQKDLPPLMNDDVYRLKGIGKVGSYRTRLIENGIKTVFDFFNRYNNNPEGLRTIIGMPKGILWEKAVAHATEAYSESQKLKGPINLPAPDQNSFEIIGSSSNALVQLNGVRQFPSYADCEIPISDMSNSARSLPAPEAVFESRNSVKSIFITTKGVWKGKEQLDRPLDVLAEGNSRSYVSNKLDIGSQSLRHKRLKILFIARLKVTLQRSQKSKHSDTSSYCSEPQCDVPSPINIDSIDCLMEIYDMMMRTSDHGEFTVGEDDDLWS